MTTVLFKNARVFDGFNEECPEGMNVFVEDGLFREVSHRLIRAPSGTQTIDVAGGTLMPGLIDAHIHAYSCDVNWHKMDTMGEAYRTAHAGVSLSGVPEVEKQ